MTSPPSPSSATPPTGSTLAPKDSPVRVLRRPSPRRPFGLALRPLTQSDDDKLSGALQRLLAEDPALVVERNEETGQTVLRGSGDTHLAVALERLARKFGVNVETEDVRVPYRETITGSAEAEGKIKKQSGGHGQFAVAHLRVSPMVARRRHRVRQLDRRRHDPQAVHPGGPARRRGDDGHAAACTASPSSTCASSATTASTTPSTRRTWRSARRPSHGLKEALQKAGAAVLEPISLLTVTVPEGYQGDVLGDLNARRGRVSGTSVARQRLARDRRPRPAAEIQRYAVELRSMTGGRGTFVAVHDHYDLLPSHLTEKVKQTARAADGRLTERPRDCGTEGRR